MMSKTTEEVRYIVSSENMVTGNRSFGILQTKDKAEAHVEYLNAKTDMFYYWVEQTPSLDDILSGVDGVEGVIDDPIYPKA